MMKIFIFFATILTIAATAQQKDKHLPKGNDAFEDKKYAVAESQYRISQSKARTNPASAYNLGNSIYRQGQASEAKSAFRKALKDAKTYPQKHRAFHNLGNVLMKEKDYAGAVEAYKNALRNDPSDEETRYNYALAKQYLKDNPPPKDKNKDKKDQKDKDKKDDKKDPDKKEDQKKDDQKDQGDKDKDKKGNQDQQKNPNQDNPQPNQPPKPQGGIPKERLKNLLDAVNNEEKKIQDKVNAKKVKARPVETEKDW